MLKKVLLATASSLLIAGAASAETILVNDGGDNDGTATVVTTSNPAPEFANAGFFGGVLGGTDVAAANNSLAHRFDISALGVNTNNIASAVLTVEVAQEFAGVANDRILAGNTTGGATAGSSLSDITSFIVQTGNTITIDLLAAGLLSVIQGGFIDVLLTDDREVDFLSLTVSEVPVPAALPLMASALIGGSIAMRRRRKA